MIKKRYPSLQLTEQSLRNTQHSKQELHLRQFEQTKGISLPNLNLRNVDYYGCDQEFQRLQVWAQEYFSNEYIETRVHAMKHHTEKGKSLQDQYIKYELLQFSLKKYYETINRE